MSACGHERILLQAARGIGLALLAGLAGCNDPAIDLGAPPALSLQEQHIVVPLDRGERNALRSAIATLGGSEGSGAIRARVDVADTNRAARVRITLVELGLEPAKIETLDRGGDVVVLSRTQVRAESCARSITPAADGDIIRSTFSLGECVQANALASMLADPADLATPVRLSPADATHQVLAVQRWRQGSAPSVDSGAAAGGDASAAGSQAGGSGVGPAAGAANPLLSGVPLPAASGASTP